MFPILTDPMFEYTRLKGVIWGSGGLTRPSLVTTSAGKLLASRSASMPIEQPLLVNCSGVTSVADHALDALAEPIEAGHVIILHSAQSIYEDIAGRYNGIPNSTHENKIICFGKKRPNEQAIAEMLASVPKLEDDFTRSAIASCFHRFPDGKSQRLISTPLLATGLCDLSKVLANPRQFQWVALLMADRLQKFLISKPHELHGVENTELRLLAVSLRASPLAVAIALLAEQKVDLVDHMGPIQKILEEDRVTVRNERRLYIFIADFIVGGSELRVAKAFAALRHSEIIHAIAVGTYLAESDYSVRPSVEALGNLRSTCPEMLLSF